MNGISKTTKKLIYDFSRKLTLEYPKDEITGESTAHMSCYVPDDIKIDRSNGLWDKNNRCPLSIRNFNPSIQ